MTVGCVRAIATAALCAGLVIGCGGPAGEPAGESRPAGSTPPSAEAPGSSHLRTQQARFVRADGAPFEWRGVSAFRLAEMVARGKAADAEAYLTWAASARLTVVRVFTMAHHLFRLSPQDGRAALPLVLELAAARGLYVEVVALADTAEITVDLDAHVRAIGEIAAGYPNALVEIANEPGHPTQGSEVHRPEVLRKLAALVPASVPVALGSLEYGDGFAAADYATWHVPRDAGHEGWGHVLRVADGAPLVDRFRKPVVSDEPIGAASKFSAGRRDDEPARFAAAAAVTRFAGMQPTFHYESGLQATPAAGRELECLQAWTRGLDLVGRLPQDRGEFLSMDRAATVATVDGARATYGRVVGGEAWLLLVDPVPNVSVKWVAPWRASEDWEVPGVRLFRGRRD
jgi:hypothetical protein